VIVLIVSDNPLDEQQAMPVLLALLANNPNIKSAGKYRRDDLWHSISNDSVLESFAAFDRSNRAGALAWLEQHRDAVCRDARRIAIRFDTNAAPQATPLHAPKAQPGKPNVTPSPQPSPAAPQVARDAQQTVEQLRAQIEQRDRTIEQNNRTIEEANRTIERMEAELKRCGGCSVSGVASAVCAALSSESRSESDAQASCAVCCVRAC
jgi:hypothetical protein